MNICGRRIGYNEEAKTYFGYRQRNLFQWKGQEKISIFNET